MAKGRHGHVRGGGLRASVLRRAGREGLERRALHLRGAAHDHAARLAQRRPVGVREGTVLGVRDGAVDQGRSARPVVRLRVQRTAGRDPRDREVVRRREVPRGVGALHVACGHVAGARAVHARREGRRAPPQQGLRAAAREAEVEAAPEAAVPSPSPADDTGRVRCGARAAAHPRDGRRDRPEDPRRHAHRRGARRHPGRGLDRGGRGASRPRLRDQGRAEWPAPVRTRRARAGHGGPPRPARVHAHARRRPRRPNRAGVRGVHDRALSGA